ncbi:hypothetical protein EXN66_Car022122 [Channa argus]|uniref:Uncharacterized protein n=1 Tax=Channa argus TaxID=215402 RepID=A0A6G1QUP5_CHAAH|nr:hypothetical protein EXN66_Car022122 [Channa argus]
MHVFGLWEETGVTKGNPCKNGENIQTQKGRSQYVDLNRGLSSCEVAVLTTPSLCC